MIAQLFLQNGWLIEWRCNIGLPTVEDWANTKLFGHESGHCPRCGLVTHKDQELFCFDRGVSTETIFAKVYLISTYPKAAA